MLANVTDYRLWAQRRLSRLAFDYLEGGAQDGCTTTRNNTIADQILFRPRVLTDVTTVDPSISLFQRKQSLPVVVGPTGLNGLFWPGADEILAVQAHKAGVPFALSTASTSTIETVRDVTSGDLWLQLYVQQDRKTAESLMQRAKAANYSTLILTVDTPVHGKRDHDHRNSFKLPLRISPRMATDFIRHPGWLWQMIRSGGPQLVNLAKSANVGTDIQVQAAALSRQMDMSLSWNDIKWLRSHWDGPIIIKGILSVQDAVLAQQHGADGIVLSNHGGRQLPSVPTGLELLSPVLEAVGKSMNVLIDGGFRRGSDIVKAQALGASAVLLGRAPLYGVAAAGSQGVSDILTILQNEIEITMRLIGRTHMHHITTDAVMWANELRPSLLHT